MVGAVRQAVELANSAVEREGRHAKRESHDKRREREAAEVSATKECGILSSRIAQSELSSTFVDLSYPLLQM